MKIIIREKIIPINSSTQFRQTAKSFASSSENVIRYEFLTGKHILSEKDLLEEAHQPKELNICF